MIKIREALHLENVLSDLKAKDMESAIRELAEGLNGDPRVLDLPAFLQEVFQRETAASTVLGNGLAIPHARTSNVTRLCLVAGVSREGIPTENGGPVHFIILAGVPHAMASEYLRILGCLARVFTTPGSAAALMKASSPQDFVDVLERLSQKL